MRLLTGPRACVDGGNRGKAVRAGMSGGSCCRAPIALFALLPYCPIAPHFREHPEACPGSSPPPPSRLSPQRRGVRWVVSGSHGGRYPGYLADRAAVRAVIFNDAGVGREGAGIASLADLERHRHRRRRGGATPAPASATRPTCWPAGGWASRMPTARRGLWAWVPGTTCREAAERLLWPRRWWGRPLGALRRDAQPARSAGGATRRVVLVDSTTQVEPADADRIVVTGSHGGLVDGDPRLALRVAGFAGYLQRRGHRHRRRRHHPPARPRPARHPRLHRLRHLRHHRRRPIDLARRRPLRRQRNRARPGRPPRTAGARRASGLGERLIRSSA